MSDAKRERHKRSKARKVELEQRRAKAYRRRQGLSRDEEEAELASYIRRFVAFCLDQVLYFIFFVFFSVVAFIFIGKDQSATIFGIVPIIIFGLGYVAPRFQKRGQTFGCRKAKIVVISEDGKGFLSYKRAVIRWGVSTGIPTLGYFVIALFSSSPGVLLVAAVFNMILIAAVAFPIIRTPNRQGFHDKYAGSVVVREMKF